jgi:hypothetical protein
MLPHQPHDVSPLIAEAEVFGVGKRPEGMRGHEDARMMMAKKAKAKEEARKELRVVEALLMQSHLSGEKRKALEARKNTALSTLSS